MHVIMIIPVFLVLIVIIAVVYKRKKISNFISNLPFAFQATQEDVLLKSGKSVPWYFFTFENCKFWLTFQKNQNTDIHSRRYLKIEFVIMTLLNTGDARGAYEKLFRLFVSKDSEMTIGNVSEREKKNLQGFFHRQVMVAPAVEIFADNKTPLQNSEKWVVRVTIPFKTNLDYLKNSLVKIAAAIKV